MFPDDIEDYPQCPTCKGVGGFLGPLGRLLWFRCQCCGIEWSEESFDIDPTEV